MMHDLDDSQLIRQALTGDRMAVDSLVRRQRPAVFAIALRALGNADDASDVTQDALMYAVQRLGTIRDARRLPGYLRSVALSLCAEYRRRRGTRRLGDSLPAFDAAGENADYAQRIVVRGAVAHLPPRQRDAVLLHYVGGWSLDEIAQITASPRDTVRSRLMAGKRLLRDDLRALFPDTGNERKTRTNMSVSNSFALSEKHESVIQSVFPGARILSVEELPELWMPFHPRVNLLLTDGSEKTVDFRNDIDPARAKLVAVLDSLGIPGPRMLHAPVEGAGCLCESPRGENLTHWATGGTPHRIRLATERAFAGIDRLQGITEALRRDPIAQSLEQRTLADEAALLRSDAKWSANPWLAEEGKHRAEWLRDAWFNDALKKVTAAVADIHTPLVYTNYPHFFPQGYRIQPAATAVFDGPLGWPGDSHYGDTPLVEFVYLWGHFGDPLLGLAMVWVYDCYPFVHTGFVEEFLWRRDVARREFAPRLALKALQMVARDLPTEQPVGDRTHRDRLRGWVDQSLAWM